MFAHVVCCVQWLTSSSTSLVCWCLILPVGLQCPMAETSTSAAPREVEERSVDGETLTEEGLLFWMCSFGVFLQGKRAGLGPECSTVLSSP